jgi:hypothetical protein
MKNQNDLPMNISHEQGEYQRDLFSGNILLFYAFDVGDDIDL